MGSKFGFDKKAAAIDGLMLGAMKRLAFETKDYFVKSFDNEAWGKVKWADLKRKEPPAKLNVTGTMKQRTQDSIKLITKSKVLMENTATDDRGRRYSNYHNEGTDRMPRRSFMKQTSELTDLQVQILIEETGKIWKRI